jgi:hypothetical protein
MVSLYWTCALGLLGNQTLPYLQMKLSCVSNGESDVWATLTMKTMSNDPESLQKKNTKLTHESRENLFAKGLLMMCLIDGNDKGLR